uniref:Uncharacterized protein n=1 Tax=Strigamia maritima TaxID=126957 RepID=T1J891_STRMM
MNQLSHSFGRKILLIRPIALTSVRERHKRKPRGWKHTDGHYVPSGAPLVYQYNLYFHPGLNVGIACNLTLYALEKGKVVISCELAQPDWDHVWMNKYYPNKQGQLLYKKYYHVIPEPQSQKFNLVNQI